MPGGKSAATATQTDIREDRELGPTLDPGRTVGSAAGSQRRGRLGGGVPGQ